MALISFLLKKHNNGFLTLFFVKYFLRLFITEQSTCYPFPPLALCYPPPTSTAKGQIAVERKRLSPKLLIISTISKSRVFTRNLVAILIGKQSVISIFLRAICANGVTWIPKQRSCNKRAIAVNCGRQVERIRWNYTPSEPAPLPVVLFFLSWEKPTGLRRRYFFIYPEFIRYSIPVGSCETKLWNRNNRDSSISPFKLWEKNNKYRSYSRHAIQYSSGSPVTFLFKRYVS